MGGIANLFSLRIADADAFGGQSRFRRKARTTQVHDGEGTKTEPNPPIPCSKEEKKRRNRRDTGGKVQIARRPKNWQRGNFVVGEDQLECDQTDGEECEESRRKRHLTVDNEIPVYDHHESEEDEPHNGGKPNAPFPPCATI